MKPITNISDVKEAGEGFRLPAGGYVCQYKHVEDVPAKKYLYMEFDIAEGEYKGYYTDLAGRAGFWGGKCYRSYSEKALPMFKRMCSAVSKSNANFIFDGNQYADEKTLVGKYTGIILGEEEYVGNDGSIKTRLYVSRECEVSKIREGNYKIPEFKRLETTGTAIPDSIVNVPADAPEESPFN